MAVRDEGPAEGALERDPVGANHHARRDQRAHEEREDQRDRREEKPAHPCSRDPIGAAMSAIVAKIPPMGRTKLPSAAMPPDRDLGHGVGQAHPQHLLLGGDARREQHGARLGERRHLEGDHVTVAHAEDDGGHLARLVDPPVDDVAGTVRARRSPDHRRYPLSTEADLAPRAIAGRRGSRWLKAMVEQEARAGEPPHHGDQEREEHVPARRIEAEDGAQRRQEDQEGDREDSNGDLGLHAAPLDREAGALDPEGSSRIVAPE